MAAQLATQMMEVQSPKKNDFCRIKGSHRVGKHKQIVAQTNISLRTQYHVLPRDPRRWFSSWFSARLLSISERVNIFCLASLESSQFIHDTTVSCPRHTWRWCRLYTWFSIMMYWNFLFAGDNYRFGDRIMDVFLPHGFCDLPFTNMLFVHQLFQETAVKCEVAKSITTLRCDYKAGAIPLFTFRQLLVGPGTLYFFSTSTCRGNRDPADPACF